MGWQISRFVRAIDDCADSDERPKRFQGLKNLDRVLSFCDRDQYSRGTATNSLIQDGGESPGEIVFCPWAICCERDKDKARRFLDEICSGSSKPIVNC